MFIKICGITNACDLEFIKSSGANACGFIFHRASPRYIAPDMAATLHSGSLSRVGVFVEQDYDAIARVRDMAKLDLIQLHGRQSQKCAAKLGKDNVIKVFWPQKYSSAPELQRDIDEFADYCAWYLLDAGKSSGGSGQTLDWELLSRIRFPNPWLLAGGLNPENIEEALRVASPDGADFNSGVETSPGNKDKDKISKIIKKITNLKF